MGQDASMNALLIGTDFMELIAAVTQNDSFPVLLLSVAHRPLKENRKFPH